MIRFVLSKDHQAMLNRCEVSEDLRLCCEKLKKSVTGLKKNAGKDILTLPSECVSLNRPV